MSAADAMSSITSAWRMDCGIPGAPGALSDLRSLRFANTFKIAASGALAVIERPGPLTAIVKESL
jgi:hypothetical protein